MTANARDLTHVFEKLINGLVPERGLDTFAVGIEAERGELHRQLELVSQDEGALKFLRGGYGCGKTFMARLAILDAQRRETSLRASWSCPTTTSAFTASTTSTARSLPSSAPRRAPGVPSGTSSTGGWPRSRKRLISLGADENADDFDDQVRAKLEEELADKTGGKAPEDFVRVVRTIFDLKQRGDLAEAGALISWLAGSGNVSAAAKKAAGIKGDIGSRDALDYLRGILEITKSAGYRGLLIVIDEAETILRMRSDSRHKSLNGIRQIVDAAGSYPGLLWIFTGTPEFFDSRHGVAGLAPLHDRIRFMKQGSFANRRQAQLELRPFDAERLRAVALRLRELFPTADRSRLEACISDSFIDQLVDEVTMGFKGDVGVVPRQFLREFINQLGLVEDNPGYDPSRKEAFEATELSPEERQAAHGKQEDLEEDAGPIPHEDAW